MTRILVTFYASEDLNSLNEVLLEEIYFFCFKYA